MTTTKLREYIQVLQEMNVMSFAGRWTDEDTSCMMEFSLTLSPMSPAVGNVPEPGAWKSPQHLDSEKLFEYDKEPNV